MQNHASMDPQTLEYERRIALLETTVTVLLTSLIPNASSETKSTMEALLTSLKAGSDQPNQLRSNSRALPHPSAVAREKPAPPTEPTTQSLSSLKTKFEAEQQPVTESPAPTAPKTKKWSPPPKPAPQTEEPAKKVASTKWTVNTSTTPPPPVENTQTSSGREDELALLRRNSVVKSFSSKVQENTQSSQVVSAAREEAAQLVGKTQVKEKAAQLAKAFEAIGALFKPIDTTAVKLNLTAPNPSGSAKSSLMDAHASIELRPHSLVSMPTPVERSKFQNFYRDFEMCLQVILSKEWVSGQNLLDAIKVKHPDYVSDPTRKFKLDTLQLILWNNWACSDDTLSTNQSTDLFSKVMFLCKSIGLQTFKDHDHSFAYDILMSNWSFNNLRVVLEHFQSLFGADSFQQAKSELPKLFTALDQVKLYRTESIVSAQENCGIIVAVIGLRTGDDSIQEMAMCILEEVELNQLQSETLEILGLLYVQNGIKALHSGDQVKAQELMQKALNLK